MSSASSGSSVHPQSSWHNTRSGNPTAWFTRRIRGISLSRCYNSLCGVAAAGVEINDASVARLGDKGSRQAFSPVHILTAHGIQTLERVK